jgi:hypothetical protein
VILHKCIQLFQLRLSPEQSGKVEYERERLLGIANKFIHLLAIPSTFRARIRLFRFARGTTLIEIAVYRCHDIIYFTYLKTTLVLLPQHI